MLQNINLDVIKQYNASLNQYKAKAAKLNAEIEYTTNEINNLCAELSTELGIEVTKDNIEQIYNDQVAKINSTLQSGTAVLRKIADEEQSIATAGQKVEAQTTPPVQTTVATSSVQTPVQQTQTVQQTVQNTQTIQPQMQAIQNQAQTVQTGEMPKPIAGSVFGAVSQIGDAPEMQNLPPLFSI